MKIKDLEPDKALASLGSETVKVVIKLENRETADVSIPTGISAGKYEARKVSADEGIYQIQKIKHLIINHNWTQETLDAQLEDLSLGANASLAISASFWKAISRINYKQKLKFPKLMLLLFEGGKHGNPNISMQEFMIIEESLKDAIEDFRRLRNFLEKKGLESTVGAEGGFSPLSFNDIQALKTIEKIFPNRQIALDAAASFKKGTIPDYDLILSKYKIASLEDPFSDEEWDLWVKFCTRFGKRVMIVGDDLTATNTERINKAVSLRAINAVVIKPNQNGTISGTIKAAEIAKKGNIKIVVSHRGEETIDNWIVDFAIKIEADFVKFGGMDRGERIAKYNRLSELGMV
ncbi:MAG: hypothetical protein A3B44_00780 [Candidatus Levybacteria bacterium RIFCSPLOWO2_01_FULL_38_21]|nr:MAG: hypothetical protein A3B44_00780 [Candidatus Levybacteria bacterium RIFCSPLOWO2_01_FULL_38_21]